MDQLKQALIDVDYPNVHALSKDEVGTLFEKDNFPKFLRWFVGELLADAGMAASYTDAEIAKIICNFGYCTKKQSDDFFTASLNFHDQFEMIQHMLSNLSINKKLEKQGETNTYQDVTLAELNDLVTRELDLFPTLTGSKEYTEEERDDQVTTLEDQIKELEDKLAGNEEEMVTGEKLPLIKAEEASAGGDLSAAVECFLLSTSKITEIQSNVKKVGEEKVEVAFSDDFLVNLSDYSDDTSELYEYFNNMNIVDDFNEDEKVIEESEFPPCVSSVDKLLKVAELL